MLDDLYLRLYDFYGAQNWWPLMIDGDVIYPSDAYERTRTETEAFEIAVGALLAQNTAWWNASRAVLRLKQENALNPSALAKVSIEQLAEWIHPAGYFNQKAKKIKKWVEFQTETLRGEVLTLRELDPDEAREAVLSVWGIGPETADSILLYAADVLFFVVDAYTRRLFSRLGWLSADEDYDPIREWISARVPKDMKTYKEFHALIVRHCVEHCKKKPLCGGCPIGNHCGYLNTGVENE